MNRKGYLNFWTSLAIFLILMIVVILPSAGKEGEFQGALKIKKGTYDLMIVENSFILSPKKPKAGEKFSASVKIRNAGTGDIDDHFDVKFDVGGTVKTVFINGLNAGQEQEVLVFFNEIKLINISTVKINIEVDSDNSIKEISEINNSLKARVAYSF